ncbi:hypothetical protein AHF37_12073 [Paragonimus kellicotti]|nr:hypothetical protein AHF37_12073 [Paragonimus kellicotti]
MHRTSNSARYTTTESSVPGSIRGRRLPRHSEAKKNTDELQFGRDAKEFALLGPQIVSTFPPASGPLPPTCCR